MAMTSNTPPNTPPPGRPPVKNAPVNPGPPGVQLESDNLSPGKPGDPVPRAINPAVSTGADQPIDHRQAAENADPRFIPGAPPNYDKVPGTMGASRPGPGVTATTATMGPTKTATGVVGAPTASGGPGPATRTLQTSAKIRNYANGNFGPATDGPCTALRGGPGLVITEYGLNAGARISLAFTVATGSKMCAFKFANEVSQGAAGTAMEASISTSPNDVGRLAYASGRSTTTDQPHCQYQDKIAGAGVGTNPSIVDLEGGKTYYYNMWATDNLAHAVPLGHQEGN